MTETPKHGEKMPDSSIIENAASTAAPVAATTAAPAEKLVLPTAADLEWAEDVKHRVRHIFRRRHALAYLGEKLIETVEQKQLWRMNHILTGSFRQNSRPFSKAGLADKSALRDAASLLSDKELKKYPKLGENAVSTVELAANNDYMDGLRLLMGQGLYDPGDVYRAVIAAAHRGDASRMQSMIDLLPEEEGKKYDLDKILLEAAVDERKVGIMQKAAEARPELFRRPETLVMTMSKTSSLEIFDFVFDRLDTAAKKAAASDSESLLWAIRFNREAAAIKLIEAGADVKGKAEGWVNAPSLLQVAASHGLARSVRLMLDKGADPQYRNAEGKSVLDYAIQYAGQSAEGVLDVLIERTTIDPDDAKRCMAYKCSGGSFSKLKSIALTPKPVEPGMSWKLMGSEQVGTVSSEKETGVQITELFNFATKEHLIVSRNPETQTDTLLLRETFDEVKNKAALAAAEARLKPKAPPLSAAPAAS